MEHLQYFPLVAAGDRKTAFGELKGTVTPHEC